MRKVSATKLQSLPTVVVHSTVRSNDSHETCHTDRPAHTLTCYTHNNHRTTIIESIKYAITGTLPPGGAKAGQSFLHDPKAIGSQLVKAQVKLRFTSRNGQVMVVVRSKLVT
jgi:DNA repair protein RAD50